MRHPLPLHYNFWSPKDLDVDRVERASWAKARRRGETGAPTDLGRGRRVQPEAQTPSSVVRRPEDAPRPESLKVAAGSRVGGAIGGQASGSKAPLASVPDGRGGGAGNRNPPAHSSSTFSAAGWALHSGEESRSRTAAQRAATAAQALALELATGLEGPRMAAQGSGPAVGWNGDGRIAGAADGGRMPRQRSEIATHDVPGDSDGAYSYVTG